MQPGDNFFLCSTPIFSSSFSPEEDLVDVADGAFERGDNFTADYFAANYAWEKWRLMGKR